MYVYMNGMVVTSGIVMSILGSSPKKYVSPCHPQTGPLVSSHGVFWNSAPSDFEAECNSHFFKKHPTKKMHVAPNFNGNSWEVNVTRIPLNCQVFVESKLQGSLLCSVEHFAKNWRVYQGMARGLLFLLTATTGQHIQVHKTKKFHGDKICRIYSSSSLSYHCSKNSTFFLVENKSPQGSRSRHIIVNA